MKSKLKTLALSISIPLLTGILSSFFSGPMDTYQSMPKPPLSPPAILFPIVWTILYILMGIASYLIHTSGKAEKQISSARTIYAIQLIVNFWWSIFFFRFEWYLFAFLWLVLLWALIALMIRKFYQILPAAAYLLIPYLLWVSFAGYLNFAIL